MSILGTNNELRAKELAEKYRLWQHELISYNVIKENIKKELIVLMKLENIDKVDKVRLVQKPQFEPIEIKDIYELVNDKSLVDSVVVSIDFESTKRNLKIKTGWNDKMIEQFLERLLETSKTMIDELEVKEK